MLLNPGPQSSAGLAVTGNGLDDQGTGGKSVTTLALAEKIRGTRRGGIPADAVAEAKRSLLNWMGVAVGAAMHPMVDMVLAVTAAWGGAAQATVAGRGLKVDEHTAALVNGITSHIFDYDDTLLDTILHPSAPVFPALLAYCERHGVSGQTLLEAFVVGVEVEQRIAQVVYPSHYDRGWHITGSVGAFGAAAAVGWLMGLDARRMAHALGLAATQPTGLREMFGTHTKPFHPGKAAANGLLAAYLAERGFTSSLKSIEAPRGFAHVTSEAPKLGRLTEGWGETWQVMYNSYKPFPCGVVIHPANDAVVRLREQHGVLAEDVERLELSVHPLVLELTGKKEPRDGLEAKFSVYHCAAAGLIDGWVGLAQFTDERVTAPDVVELRGRVAAAVEPGIHEDQIRVKAVLRGGRGVVELFVEHCLGSKDNPMTDELLERKFREAAGPVLGAARARELMDAIWGLEAAADVHGMMALSGPARG